MTRLLAKAERTDNDEEAQAYYAKAAELMTKHGIEQAMLDATKGQEEFPTQTALWFGGSHAFERMQGAYLVGKAAFGETLRFLKSRGDHYDYLQISGEKRHRKGFYAYVIGFTADLREFEALWASIDLQAASSLRRWWKEQMRLRRQGEWPGWFQDWVEYETFSEETAKAKARKAYLYGYFAGVAEKIEGPRQQVVDSIPGAALVLVTKEAKVAEVYDNTVKKKKRPSRHQGYGAGYYDGVRDGKQARTNQPTVPSPGRSAVGE